MIRMTKALRLFPNSVVNFHTSSQRAEGQRTEKILKKIIGNKCVVFDIKGKIAYKNYTSLIRIIKSLEGVFVSALGPNELAINQVTLLGRVGSDPQKRGNQEHPVVNFSLATHFSYRYESGDILQRTDWHRISIFKPGLRETVYNYLKKGQRVYVTGKLSYGEVKLDDGQVRTASTIVADDVIFFQNSPQESQEQ